MKYVVENCEKSFCDDCGQKVVLLCTKDYTQDIIQWPWFYICWACKKVSQIGRGPVETFPSREI
jgi:hypothetical protein